MGKERFDILFTLDDRATRAFGQPKRAMQDFERQIKKNDVAVKKFGRSVKAEGDKIAKSLRKQAAGAKHVKNAMKIMGTAIATGAIATVIKASKVNREYGKGIAEVATLTEMNVDETNKFFESTIEGTQRAFGKKQIDIIKALYDTISAGIPEKGANKFLRSVGKLAVGGVTTMAEATDLLTTAFNTYGKQGRTVTELTDTMFQIMRKGKITIPQLAQNFGDVASFGAFAGISLEQLGAAIATVTKSDKPQKSFTNLKAAIANLAKAPPEAKKQFQKLGIQNISLTLKNKDLAGTLALIKEKVEAKTKSLGKQRDIYERLFGSVEAFKTIMSLVGFKAKSFQKDIDAMNNKLGVTDEAFNKIAQTSQHSMDKTQAAFEIALKRLGKALEPAEKVMYEWGTNASNAIADGITSPAAREMLAESFTSVMTTILKEWSGYGIIQRFLEKDAKEAKKRKAKSEEFLNESQLAMINESLFEEKWSKQKASERFSEAAFSDINVSVGGITFQSVALEDNAEKVADNVGKAVKQKVKDELMSRARLRK